MAGVLCATACGGVNTTPAVGEKSENAVHQTVRPAILEPALEDRLKTAAPDELIEVQIVLKVPTFDGSRPDPGAKLTQEEMDAFLARNNRAETVSLAIKANQVRRIAAWQEVALVETVKYAQKEGETLGH